MDIEQVLRCTEEGLRNIRLQLNAVTAHTSPASQAAVASLPASTLPPSPSPRSSALQDIRSLVEKTEQQLRSQAAQLHRQQQHDAAVAASISAVPINPDAGLRSRSTAAASSSAVDVLPLSSVRSTSPAAIPARHRSVSSRIEQSRDARFLSTPDEAASRLYIMRRFGLTEDDAEQWSRDASTRGIAVYGRTRRRRQAKPKLADAAASLSPSASGLSSRPAAALQFRYGLPPAVSLQLPDSGGDHRSDDGSRNQQLRLQASRQQWEEAKETLLDPLDASSRHEQGEAGNTARAGAEDAATPTSRQQQQQQQQQESSHHSHSHSHPLHSARQTRGHGKRGAGRSVASIAAVGALHDSFSFAPSSASSSSSSSSQSLPARSYDSLLDGFSLHPFFVQHGRLLSDTAEYRSFHRTQAAHWPSISSLLTQHLLPFATALQQEHSTPVLTFHGKAVAALAAAVAASSSPPTREELLSCLAATDADEARVRLQAADVKAEESRRNAAACLITAVLRGHVARRRYAALRRRHAAASIIQRKWRRWSALQRTRQFVRRKWEERVTAWQLLQQQWVASYSAHFSQRHRVHLHIPSLSLPAYQRRGLFPHLHWHENAHLPAVCDLRNPLVSVIFLTASALPHDVLTYYLKLLEVGGVREVGSRLHVLSPELSSFFTQQLPHPFPLASLALYSARCLASIRQLIRGRPAVIVPADAGFSDWMLAVELGLPLYCVDVEKKGRLDGCGGLRRLVESWNERLRKDRETAREKERERQREQEEKERMSTPQWRRRDELPPASTGRDGAGRAGPADGSDELYLSISACDVFDEDELLSRLTELLCRHPAVPVWVLRLDDDREGRGVAYLETARVRGLRAALQEADEAAREERVEAVLTAEFMGNVVLLQPAFHATLAAFFALFYQQGGAVLPYPQLPSFTSPLLSPTVNMLIEPNGQLTMLCSHDQHLALPFLPVLSCFPSSQSTAQLHSIAASIGKACWREGVIGHVAVDFLALPVQLLQAPPVLSLVPASFPSSSQLVPVSLHLHRTAGTSCFSLFHFLMSGRYLWRSRAAACYRVLRAGVREKQEEEARQQQKEKRHKFHRASTSTSTLEQLLHPKPAAAAGVGLSAGNAQLAPVLPTFASRLMSKRLSATLQEAEEERCYVVIPALQLQRLSQLPLASFFALCRLRHLSFDVGARMGLCFLLYGSLAGGRVGVMGVGSGRSQGLSRLDELLRLLDEEWQGARGVAGGRHVESAADSVGGAEGGEETLRDVVRLVKSVGLLLSSESRAEQAAAGHSRFPSLATGRVSAGTTARPAAGDAATEQQQQQQQQQQALAGVPSC